MKPIKRGIIIGGGGARGGFACGVAKYLIDDLGQVYDTYVGTSTGSLIATLLACNEVDKLKDAYTSITQKDIFKVNPIKVKNGEMSINLVNVFYNMIIKREKTLGDSSNLRKLIEKFMTKDDYYNIIKNNKEAISCVTNLDSGFKETKSTNNYSYKDYCDWMYASCCATPFMSTVFKDNSNYADGGFTESIPIQEAIDKGCNIIDIIILRPEKTPFQKFKYNNIIDLVSRLMDISISEISIDDINISKLSSTINDIQLNFYYTPTMLTFNALVFDKAQMLEWYNQGYNFAKNQRHKSYILNSNGCKLIKDSQNNQV